MAAQMKPEVLSILNISADDQRKQRRRSDTETRAMENLIVCCLAANFVITIVYGETRLGEVLVKIKEDRRELFHVLVCRLAYIKTQGLNPGSIEFSNALLQHGISSFNSTDALNLIDMRTLHDEPYSSGNSFSFIDPQVQKFLAAVYLCQEPLMTLIDFVKQHVVSNSYQAIEVTDDRKYEDCAEVMGYVFGLAKSGLNDCLFDALPSFIHYMSQFIVTTEPIVDNKMALLILACLRQAQDKPLCRRVHHEYFKRQIFSYKFEHIKVADLSYYLSSTSSDPQTWTIYFNDQATGKSITSLVENIRQQYKIVVLSRLQPDISKEKGRIVISNRNIDHLRSVLLSTTSSYPSVYSDKSASASVLPGEPLQESTDIKPVVPPDKSSSSSPPDSYPIKYGFYGEAIYESMQNTENVTYFNMVKDILVTPLQSYSRQVLECQYRKADHIWITGSQSLRYHFYRSVLIAPYVPMHWVKVKQPDGTKELEDKYERVANAQLLSDPTTSSPETSEIVLLNSHRYAQISVTPPTGGKPTLVYLYSNSDEAEGPGFIGCDYQLPKQHAEGKIHWKESRPFDLVKDERIGRELPLPSKRGTESGDMTATTATQALKDDPDKYKPSSSPRPITSHSQASTTSGIRPLGVTPVNEQQIKRQALEAFDTPGQCFYGDGIKFVIGQVYTQPNALPGARVLREGGNGLILEVYFEGTSYAVKRTAFRWREVLIMPKLRHKNILQLTAMMMGTPIEGYPRRRYVFHYYPKMTNDFGRLIGSYEKYCLRTLKDKFKNEKLLLNKILSNFRYISSELLQGLNYLHTLPNPIVHRDIKPSNILVLTDCDCPNPLACVCRLRPQIVLSDFDASLELAQDGTLLPDPPRSLMTQGLYLSSERTYHISPVGTIGFKSPEGYIHMIGNSSDVMPVLSTKADIFSFGLVMLLIVLAEEGPRSMSKMGVLLLHYNKKSSDGKSSLSSVSVSDKDLNKVLPFHRLKSEFSNSLPSIIDFIERSLEIDPKKRATAKELLSHSFLHEPIKL